MAGSGQPRKFSEKIAILTRKQNEDAQAFNDIMCDVRQITTGPPGSEEAPSTSKGLGPHQPAWPRPGGSLPNVNAVVNIPGMDPMAAAQMHAQAANQYLGGMGQVPMHPHMQFHPSQARVIHTKQRGGSPGAHPYHHHPYGGHSPRHHSPQSRSPHSPSSPSQGGIQRPHSNERAGGIAPLGYGVVGNPGSPEFLQLPNDQGWRRAHSDPTLHTNAQPAHQASHYAVLTPQNSLGSDAGSPQMPCDMGGQQPNTLPGEMDGGGLPVPASAAGSGSLPDLPNYYPAGFPVQYALPPYAGQGATLAQRHSIHLPVRMPSTGVSLDSSTSPYSAHQPPPQPHFTLDTTPQGPSNNSQSAPNSPQQQGTDASSPVPSPGTSAYNHVHHQFSNMSFHQQQQHQQQQQQQQHQQQQEAAGWPASPPTSYANHNSHPHPKLHQQSYSTSAADPSDYSQLNYSTLSPKSDNIPQITLTNAEGQASFDPNQLDLTDLQMSQEEIQKLLRENEVDPSSEDALRHDSN